MKKPNSVLTTLLLGNNVANIMLVILMGHLLNRMAFMLPGFFLAGWLKVLGEVLLITVFLLAVGEIFPKSIALRYSGRVAVLAIWPFYGLHQVIGIFHIRQLLTFIVWSILKIIRRLFGDKEESSNYEDIQVAVFLSEKEGHLSKEEASIIDRVLALEDADIAKFMVNRANIKAVNFRETVARAIYYSIKWQMELLPVYKDQKDSIIGVFNVNFAIQKEWHGLVGDHILAPVFIPRVNCSKLILQLLESPEDNLGVVIDEFGSFEGIVSKQNILSFLTYDVLDIPNKAIAGVDKTPDGLYVDGTLKLDELEDILNFSFPHGDYHTVGGMLCAYQDRIPQKGDWVVVAGRKFYIDQSRPNRVIKVFIPLKGRYK